jgi:hypothetical protein
MRETTKVCISCRETKFLADFHKQPRMKLGRASRCKKCSHIALDVNRKDPANAERYKLYRRRGSLKKLYGITDKQYDEMFAGQMGLCAICGASADSGKRRMSVDHCHETGRIRFLLCQKCNRGLGLFNHDRDKLQNAIRYLEIFDEEKS